MATTTTYHAQLIKYDSSGNQSILNLKNTGDDVSISRSSNGNLPSTVTSAQTLANAFGSLAFKSAVVYNDLKGIVSNELTVSTEGKIADARAIKTLADKIATNASNITKLNSNLESTKTNLSDLEGTVSGIGTQVTTNKNNIAKLWDKSFSVTLAVASWSGTAAPYTYKISNSSILATSNVDIAPATSASDAAKYAYISAGFMPGSIAAGSVTIKAYGKKPTVAIPITLIVRGKES